MNENLGQVLKYEFIFLKQTVLVHNEGVLLELLCIFLLGNEFQVFGNKLLCEFEQIFVKGLPDRLGTMEEIFLYLI